jgi:hypothetical protein
VVAPSNDTTLQTSQVIGDVRGHNMREVGPPWVDLIKAAPSSHMLWRKGAIMTARSKALANRGGVEENRLRVWTMWKVVTSGNGWKAALSLLRIAKGGLNIPHTIKGCVPPKVGMLWSRGNDTAQGLRSGAVGKRSRGIRFGSERFRESAALPRRRGNRAEGHRREHATHSTPLPWRA